MPQGGERTRWNFHGDRVVDENPHIGLKIASVELSDGTTFDQYVARMPRCAMTVVRSLNYRTPGELGYGASRLRRSSMYRTPRGDPSPAAISTGLTPTTAAS